MSEEKQTKKRGKKFEAEIGAEPKLVAEDTAIREKKKIHTGTTCKGNRRCVG